MTAAIGVLQCFCANRVSADQTGQKISKTVTRDFEVFLYQWTAYRADCGAEESPDENKGKNRGDEGFKA